MAAPQGQGDKASAPYGTDLPPPYSSVIGPPSVGDATGAYPQMGFVAGPGAAHTAPPNTYPHPAQNTQPQPAGTYPHPQPTGAYPQPQPAGAYPHPQPAGVMFAQMPGATGHVNVIVAPPVGTEPVNMYCPSCSQQITSKVDYRTSWHTHLIAGIICFSTMFFSMCCLGLVPYCLDSCKNAEHFCPNCNAYLGKYERC